MCLCGGRVHLSGRSFVSVSCAWLSNAAVPVPTATGHIGLCRISHFACRMSRFFFEPLPLLRCLAAVPWQWHGLVFFWTRSVPGRERERRVRRRVGFGKLRKGAKEGWAGNRFLAPFFFSLKNREQERETGREKRKRSRLMFTQSECKLLFCSVRTKLGACEAVGSIPSTYFVH